MRDTFRKLNEEVCSCRLCPRLVHFRETVEAKSIHKGEIYWRKPVPGFGDHHAWLMLLGLAPAPHGGNRTGRPFTGDLSGDFLIRSLYSVGLANQPYSKTYDDGLELLGCYMTPAVKCVPPAHKPLPQEVRNCAPYFHREIALLKNLTCVLALGRLAFDAYLRFLKDQGVDTKGIQFEFGKVFEFKGWPSLAACYHPTPRNTNTGTLTRDMFEELLEGLKERFGGAPS